MDTLSYLHVSKAIKRLLIEMYITSANTKYVE